MRPSAEWLFSIHDSTGSSLAAKKPGTTHRSLAVRRNDQQPGCCGFSARKGEDIRTRGRNSGKNAASNMTETDVPIQSCLMCI